MERTTTYAALLGWAGLGSTLPLNGLLGPLGGLPSLALRDSLSQAGFFFFPSLSAQPTSNFLSLSVSLPSPTPYFQPQKLNSIVREGILWRR